MSEALDFLLRVRPEAMRAHFDFFKDAGGRLDPRTRSLLSFLSKVDAQSDPGLRQYLRRALQSQAQWHELIPLASLTPGRALAVERDGRPLLIFQYPNTEPRVYDRRCPHQGTLIPETALSGRQLTCPKHGWTFDVKDGTCVKVGNRPLRSYECKIEDGKLLARW